MKPSSCDAGSCEFPVPLFCSRNGLESVFRTQDETNVTKLKESNQTKCLQKRLDSRWKLYHTTPNVPWI